MTVPVGLDVRPQEWETVRRILQRLVPDREVWAFGSRVDGRAWAFSDLDLAIVGDQPLPAARRAELREAFVESELPWKVDLVDWPAVSEGFRRRVGDRRVRLQAADPATAPAAAGIPSTPPAAAAGRTP